MIAAEALATEKWLLDQQPTIFLGGRAGAEELPISAD